MLGRRAALALVLAAGACKRPSAGTTAGPAAGPAASPASPASVSSRDDLVIRVLDVGQGDATLITNGASIALVDGGPDGEALGAQLDRLGLGRDTVIDLVVLSHAHSDHYMGLRELFASRRRLRVRYFFENRDVSPNSTLRVLRDSVFARARRGELTYRDTDDPCGDGRPVCAITMRGGARLEVLRPDPDASDPNDRSTPVRVLARDSSRFTMWLAGDAERAALRWFDAVDYDLRPGMRADVLKAGHHGSCNGVTARLLAEVRPARVVASLGAENDYGHMHAQAKSAYRAAGVPWYRTDANGTVTIRVPAAGGVYSVTPERPGESLDGPSDRRSTAAECRSMDGDDAPDAPAPRRRSRRR